MSLILLAQACVANGQGASGGYLSPVPANTVEGGSAADRLNERVQSLTTSCGLSTDQAGKVRSLLSVWLSSSDAHKA
ncbi:MAG TPA: hypothetical protein VGO93_30175, partial [Candidatus Xenobia bacterium]